MPNNQTILITGASGFVGKRLVSQMVQRGYNVRAFIRKSPPPQELTVPGVTLCYGDITDASSLAAAFVGVDAVIHAAAGNKGTDAEIRRATVEGTRHILELCAANPGVKLVHLSSCNVYEIASHRHGGCIDEQSALEPHPEQRGIYTLAKMEAEQLVTAAMATSANPIVCLRPGTVYGPGGNPYTPMIGLSWHNRLFMVFGDGAMILPLIHIDNLIEAIVFALAAAATNGAIYNVVDSQQVTKRQYMEALMAKLYPGALNLYIPMPLLTMAVALGEGVCSLLRIAPPLTKYRLLSSQNPVIYATSRIQTDLGWHSTVNFEQAVDDLVAYHQQIQ